jgi:hypothetical protein
MSDLSAKGRPPKARNQYQKRCGKREPQLFNDRFSWPLFARHCDQFLRERGLKPH